MVSKFFEKLVNSKPVVHLDKSSPFSDFQNGLMSYQPTADNLAYETLCTGEGSGLLVSILKKINLFVLPV